jgi:hypothetical protein
MPENQEELYIQKCLRLIEEQLSWGNAQDWSNYDFEKLSELVHTRTGVRLSMTTLKRIWGKLKYDSAPTRTTLNTLAQFAGYADWRTFRQTEEKPGATIEIQAEPTPEPSRANLKKHPKAYWIVVLVVMLMLTGYVLISSMSDNRMKDATGSLSNRFSFKANKVKTEGVPNSVVFHYDATAASDDSVFIVQTWDMSKKVQVPKQQHEHSSIYYYPGYFKAKLVADGEVVKTHDLWITSDGWLCVAEDHPIPLYFKKEECVKSDRVEVDEALLKSYNLSLHPKPPRIRFFNQRDMGNLMSDNFTFETVLKNNFNGGANVCQNVEVLIQCKDDVIIIPLVAKACIGDMGMYFCGKTVTSKDEDMSGFGCDLTQWTRLRVETVNKKSSIYVNGIKAYELTFPNDPTGIVGVQYRFNGVGAVKDTWFESNGMVTRLGY